MKDRGQTSECGIQGLPPSDSNLSLSRHSPRWTSNVHFTGSFTGLSPSGDSLLWGPCHGIPEGTVLPYPFKCYLFSSLTQVLILPVLSLSPYLEVTMPFLEKGGQQNIGERMQAWILWSGLNINELTQAGVLKKVCMAGMRQKQKTVRRLFPSSRGGKWMTWVGR